MDGHENAETSQADIAVFTLGGVPQVSYSENYHPASGEILARDTMRSFQELSQAVHPGAVIIDPDF